MPLCTPRRYRRFVAVIVLPAWLGGAVPASAELPRATTPPPAPREAIELTISATYARSAGRYGGASATGAAQGVASDFGLGIRTRQWSVALIGQYVELKPDRGDDLRNAKGGLGVTYHFLPDAWLDPWLAASAGYRFARSAETSAHGFEVARIAVGGDVRASQLVAAAPMIAFALDMFPWLESNTPWYASAFAGVQGRFDLSPSIE